MTKSMIFLILFILISSNLTAQRGQGYTVKDTQNRKIYFLQQGAELKVVTNTEKITIKLDSINDLGIYGNEQIYPYQSTKYLVFRNKDLLKDWKKLFWRFVLISSALTVIGFALTIIGIGSILAFFGIIGLFISIPIGIYLFILSFGIKINLH